MLRRGRRAWISREDGLNPHRAGPRGSDPDERSLPSYPCYAAARLDSVGGVYPLSLKLPFPLTPFTSDVFIP